MRILECIERVTAENEDFFVIKWRPTWFCNYQCGYCIQGNRHRPYSREDVEALQKRIEEIAPRLSNIIDRIGANKTKLELVGGECSVLELVPILGKITSKHLTRVQFTTNGHRSADYYIAMAKDLASRGVEFSLQMSWHSQQVSLDDFVEKCKKIKPFCTRFKLETVLVEETREQAKQFEEKCKAEELDYIVEVDLRDKKHESRQELREEMKESFSLKQSVPRYRCEFINSEDGGLFEQYYPTRNLFISDPLNSRDIVGSKKVVAAGKYCTYGMDYCYVDVDCVGFNEKDDGNPPCIGRIPLEKFERQPKPRICGAMCSLCGNVSLYSEEAWRRKQEREGKK